MKTTKARILTKKALALLIVSVVLIGSGAYVVWLHATGQPPFCSGYPPGGDCPGNYSYSFQVSIDYSGSWSAIYCGFHSVGAPQNSCVGIDNYTGGSFSGTGSSTRPITLSGPDTNGLAMCVQAEKLDTSNNTLTLSIGASTDNDNTSRPSGTATLCQGVVP